MATQSTTAALALGERAPDFTLPATDGQTYSLSSFARHPILVVIFSANHCPYVGAWEDRMIALGQEFGARDVAFALISSNDAQKFPQDSVEEMRKRAEEKSYPFPYVYDESQSVARAYGPTRTPEVFVFDRDRALRYHGAVDSDWEEGPNLQPYLHDALEQLLAGQEVTLPETKPVGCSLKLKS